MEKHHEKVFIIDDEQAVLMSVGNLITYFGYHCQTFQESTQALRVIKEEIPDLVFIDLVMPDQSGIEVLSQVKAIDPEIMVVIMTGHGTIESAVEAIKLGALDYISKPIETARLKIVIEKSLLQQRLIRENRELRTRLEDKHKFHNIVGRSEEVERIFRMVEKVAPSDINVLIQGESGTGKELIARAIHGYSRRRSKPFVPVDCGSIPGQLFESELFGHEKGAFTGAVGNRKGLLETATTGTLFLDEITEVNIDLQAKLLRVLQERQFRRVGGRKLLDVDMRVISATNRNPKQAISDGKLREDLYYRLNVIPIELPPLRQRQIDIPLLFYHFMESTKASGTARVNDISKEAMDILQNYQWPGNIRELKNLVQRLVTLAEGNTITTADLPPYIIKELNTNTSTAWVTILPYKEAKEKWLETFDRRYLKQILSKYHGNISKAAKFSGINRRTIYRLLDRYEIETEHRKTV